MTVATDDSPIGGGAALSYIVDGEERPKQFASRCLTKAERNYSQIEREALDIVYAVKKFYSFLFSHRFTLITDDKPLTTIFVPKSNLPVMAAERLQVGNLFVRLSL